MLILISVFILILHKLVPRSSPLAPVHRITLWVPKSKRQKIHQKIIIMLQIYYKYRSWYGYNGKIQGDISKENRMLFTLKNQESPFKKYEWMRGTSWVQKEKTSNCIESWNWKEGRVAIGCEMAMNPRKWAKWGRKAQSAQDTINCINKSEFFLKAMKCHWKEQDRLWLWGMIYIQICSTWTSFGTTLLEEAWNPVLVWV